MKKRIFFIFCLVLLLTGQKAFSNEKETNSKEIKATNLHVQSANKPITASYDTENAKYKELNLKNQTVNKSSASTHFFTLEQEEYLVEHPHVLAYFSQLYTGNKKTPAQIAKEYQLTTETTQKYLNALAKVGIIETPKNKDLSAPIQFLVQGTCRFSPYGPLSLKLTEDMFKQHYQLINNLIINQASDQGPQNGWYLSPAGFWLTKDEYEKYQQELEMIIEKYIQYSKVNLDAKKPNSFRVSIMNSAIPNWEPEVFTAIKRDF